MATELAASAWGSVGDARNLTKMFMLGRSPSRVSAGVKRPKTCFGAEAVFNAGPTSITLVEGQRMFKLWLSDYDPAGEPDQVESPTTYHEIPLDWADNLYGSFPSPFSLSERVSELGISLSNKVLELEKQIDVLKNQIEEIKNKRNALLVPTILLGVFIAPFVVGLYVSAYSWMTNSFISQDKLKNPLSPLPSASSPSTSAAPNLPSSPNSPFSKPPTLPPPASSPSTGATQNPSRPKSQG
jgi:hypothetical protein